MKCPSCSAEGPDGAPECAACGVIFAKLKAKAEKAAATPAPAPAPPASGLGGTLALLAGLCVLVYGGYRFYERRVAPPPEKPKGVLINPESYKSEISAIETAVYDGQGSVHETAAAAEAAAARIAGRILQKNPHNPLAQDAAADVESFAAQMAGAQESLGASPTARLEFVRAWETLRAKRFAPADWFHPPEAVKPGEPPDFEKAAQRILTTAQAMKTLLAGLPAEMEQFGERQVTLRSNAQEFAPPAEDVPGQWADLEKADQAAAGARGADDQKRLEAWRAWVPLWRVRVDAALTDFPKPEEIPEELKYPYQGLVRSAQEARRPPDPGSGAFLMESDPAAQALYLPNKHSRDNWCQNVTRWLSELPDEINGIREAKKAGKKS